jgi:hypothetical protein
MRAGSASGFAKYCANPWYQRGEGNASGGAGKPLGIGVIARQRRAKQSRLNIHTAACRCNGRCGDCVVMATSEARMACETVTALPALLEGRRHTMRQQGFEKDFPLPRDRILLKR